MNSWDRGECITHGSRNQDNLAPIFQGARGSRSRRNGLTSWQVTGSLPGKWFHCSLEPWSLGELVDGRPGRLHDLVTKGSMRVGRNWRLFDQETEHRARTSRAAEEGGRGEGFAGPVTGIRSRGWEGTPRKARNRVAGQGGSVTEERRVNFGTGGVESAVVGCSANRPAGPVSSKAFWGGEACRWTRSSRTAPAVGVGSATRPSEALSGPHLPGLPGPMGLVAPCGLTQAEPGSGSARSLPGLHEGRSGFDPAGADPLNGRRISSRSRRSSTRAASSLAKGGRPPRRRFRGTGAGSPARRRGPFLAGRQGRLRLGPRRA